MKKSLGVYSANADVDPFGEFQYCIQTDKFIYNKTMNSLTGHVNNQINMYTGSNQSYRGKYLKGYLQNLLSILNQKVMIYLSKEPIY